MLASVPHSARVTLALSRSIVGTMAITMADPIGDAANFIRY